MKKVLVLTLVFAMMMTLLVACGGTPTTTTTAGTTTTGTTTGGTTTTGTSTTATTTAGGKFVVGYTNLADTDMFLKYSKDIFMALCKAEANLEVIATDANGDQQKQLDQIDNFIAQEVDLIVVTPVDYEGVVPGVKKANEAGIPVIALIIDASDGKKLFIGSNSTDAGKMQGDFMKEKLPQNAQIVYLQGTPGLYHSTQRWNGFKEACLDKRSDIKVLASQTGNYNRDEGMKVMEDWIQSFEKIDAVISANDQMALGAIQALKTAKRLSGVLVTGIDATYDACVAIGAGEMTQSIFQNGKAQATKCFDVIKQTMTSSFPTDPQILIPYDSVTKDNVQKYLDDYIAQGYGK